MGIITTGGRGHWFKCTRHSSKAKAIEPATYTTEVPAEFQRPPYKRAPEPENALAANLRFTMRNALMRKAALTKRHRVRFGPGGFQNRNSCLASLGHSGSITLLNMARKASNDYLTPA
jgi:hypothetical protein